MKQFLNDLPFELIALHDLDVIPMPPEETGETLEQNAMLKARYYATETGMLAIADDGGLFIDALDGWPGIKSARSFTGGQAAQDEKMLQALRDIPEENRSASFQISIAVHDSGEETTFTSSAMLQGEITLSRVAHGDLQWGYNSIFYVPELQKTYGEMTIVEKNAISHRGKALIKVKRYLQNQFRGKHFVVPIAFIVQDGLLLINKRNDPHNPHYHGIWEFPGGGVEMGETVEESLVKECREETGYDVAIVEQLSGPFVKSFTYDTGDCQFYIVPYVCKIVGGSLNPSQDEVLETSWKSFDDVLTLQKFPGDTEIMECVRSKFKKIVSEHSL